jgi:hypothetical protein
MNSLAARGGVVVLITRPRPVQMIFQKQGCFKTSVLKTKQCLAGKLKKTQFRRIVIPRALA